MRAAALLAVALALAGCLGGPQGLVGKPVPAFSLVTSAGEPVNQTTWQGRYVILDLMATWCAPCKVEVEHLKDVHARYGERVPILSIDVDPTESSQQMDQFFLDHDATWPRAFDFDGKVGRAIGLGIPTLVIVGPDGKVVYQHEGEVTAEQIAGVVGQV